MQGMTVPTGVFAYDKNIHAFDSDDESDGPDEIDATGYINAPELPVHPRHSSGGAGLFKTLLPVLCLSMLVACDIAVPPSVILSAGSVAYGSVVLPQPYFTGNAFQLEGVYAPIDAGGSFSLVLCRRYRGSNLQPIGPR
ncbi:hypothetical protein CYMTET_49694 [Cymbomonas tetramitiformis]|uniref:Uncharacterized protein n=1 Tax=Cymbomonas tetramitiformis TaxID=36881 RepID=A0AAE0BR01_9CHLO|nr:hypothetical protein CYMTET_49694 [Cymbomonas tetramitiformis]